MDITHLFVAFVSGYVCGSLMVLWMISIVDKHKI